MKNTAIYLGLLFSILPVLRTDSFYFHFAEQNGNNLQPKTNNVQYDQPEIKTNLKKIESENNVESEWISTIQKNISESEYFISWQEDKQCFESPNRKNNLRISYSNEGFTVKPRTVIDSVEWTSEFKIAGLFRDKKLITNFKEDYTVVTNSNKLQYKFQDAAILEYINSPEGSRQNIYISDKPEGTGLLKFKMNISTDLQLHLNSSNSLQFGTEDFYYTDLHVWDQNHHQIKAWFELNENEYSSELAIVVDDENAIYPLVIDPLSVVPNKTFESDQAYAYFSQAVADEGDINGDGLNDLVIASPNFDNGNSDEGKVFIYHGSPSGFNSIPSSSLELNVSNLLFGSSVCFAGDVNNDGFDDVLVGTPRYTNVQSSEGAAFLYYGTASGISPTYSWMAESNQISANYGAKVTGLGDINNDGFDDFGAAAAYFDNGQSTEGKIFVYYGESGVISSVEDWSYESNIAFANFGSDLSGAGDVNGDGYDDLIAGAYYFTNDISQQGKAYVFFGSSSGLSLTPSWTAEGNSVSGNFGSAVNDAGDINGDGYDEILIGAYTQTGEFSTSGKAYIYNGSPTGPAVTPSWTGNGTMGASQYGFACNSAGDINNDGYNDVIIGAPHVTNTYSLEGAVYIYLGSSSGLNPIPQNIIYGKQTNARIGRVLGHAGDLNQDAFEDIILGCYEYDNGSTDEGVANIYYGQSDGIGAVSYFPQLNQIDAGFGSQAIGFQSNSESYLIISAPYYDNGNVNEGLVNVYGYSKYTGLIPTPTYSIEGGQDNAKLGFAIANVNDANGDGKDEVLISAPGFDNGQTDEGIVYLYDPVDEDLLWSFESNQSNAQIGISLSGSGDVNRDGYADFFIGSSLYDGATTDGGAILFFYGDPLSYHTIPDLIIQGTQANSGFAFSSNFAGDVNGDSYDDIICGAPNFDNGQTDEGRIYIFFGSPEGFNTIDPFIYENNQANSYLGTAICGGININNDALADIAVSAPYYDDGEVDEGIVYLFTGNSTDLNIAGQLEINQAAAHFGNSISFLTDINQDYSDELIVGAPLFDDGETDEGGVFIYMSKPGGIYNDSLRTILTSNLANFQYGEFINKCKSLDKDLSDEILIGCPHGEEGELNEGLVFIYYSINLHPPESADYPVFIFNTDPTTFGYEPLGNCDINGDGFKDIVIGVPYYDNGQTNEGKILIYFGNENGIDSIPDQQYERNIASFFFGKNMDVAGDVNGDGFDDLVFGYSAFSSPQSNEGVVELYLGGPSGLITPFYRQYQGNATGKLYGSVCKGAHDINGDGLDDFVAGCSSTTGGYSNGQTNEGAILVFYGNAVSISTVPDLIVESNVTSRCLGYNLATGDVNGDGYGDVLASAANSAVFLYYGSSSGLQTTYAWTVANPTNFKFNETIAISPDVNGDGYGDIFVSARMDKFGDHTEGSVFGYYGTPTIPSASENWRVWSNQIPYELGDNGSSYFGHYLDASTDFNGDGYYDLIVTAEKSELDQLISCCESYDEGEIRVYFGTEQGLEEDYNVRIEGKLIDGEFGCALAGLGDINNDGYDDFITGSNHLSTNNLYIINGYNLNQQPVKDEPLQAQQFDSGFGEYFNYAGDVNGDGYADIMVTAPEYDENYEDVGRLYIYYGSPQGTDMEADFILDGTHRVIFNAAPAGDVNGDGYSDILVLTLTDEFGIPKQINCYYGSKLGLQSQNYSVHLVDAQDELYYNFTRYADLNQDGFGDVVISNPWPDIPSGGNIYVFLGSASGLSTSPFAIIQGDAGTAFGSSIAITDANGDGYHDIVVSSSDDNYSGIYFNTTKLFLYKGNASGVELTSSWIYTGPVGASYGNQVENLGDINGDGFADIILHTESVNFDNYYADIFLGSETGFSATPDWTFTTDMVADKLTGKISPAGDQNNDGYTDLLVPCAVTGKIYLFYGGVNGFADTPDDFIVSPLPKLSEDNFDLATHSYSTKIVFAGDQNGDGYLEYAAENYYDITADWNDRPYYNQSIYFIQKNNIEHISNGEQIMQSNQGNSQLGYSIADAGDVNGDGINDMIVGAPFYDNGQTDEGKIFVFYGSNNNLSLTADWSAEINKANANFGVSVAHAGDVNGDGYADIIAGANKLTHGESQEGGAYIYYGSPSGLTATPLKIESNQAKANLGGSVSGAGDINRDGYSDIIIGAEKYDNGLQDEGVVYVHYGSATGINPIPNVILENNKKKSGFGHSVSTAGDVNGDGYSDIIISADKYSGGQTQEGKAYVYLGSASGIVTTPSWSYESNQANSAFGCAISAAGDVNGDAFADILIGAYNYDLGQTDEGAGFIFYGSSSGVSAIPNWTGQSSKTAANYGYSVAGGGDINSDGYSDIVIGAPFYDNIENNEGKIYVYFGSPEGLNPNIGWTVEGNKINKQLGFSVNNRCDLNADSYTDILCGSNTFGNPEINEGIAEIYYGNGPDNKRNNIVLFNSDLTTSISALNLPETDFGFHFFRIDMEGNGYSKAQWEIKNEGSPFSSSTTGALVNSFEFTDEQPLSIFADSAGSYFYGNANKIGNINKIRLRQKYDLVNSFDGKLYGPWRYYGSPVMVGPVPGLKEIEDENLVTGIMGLKIYPVPATNVLNIEITLNNVQNETAIINLLNVNGELITSSQFTLDNDKTLLGIDCCMIPPGTYFISCITNEQITTKKFVKL